MTNTKKVLLGVGSLALLVVVYAFGTAGNKQIVQVGAGGPITYADSHFVGDLYNGLGDTKMLSGGYVVGPLKVGTNGGTITTILTGTATYNPPSLADGAIATTTITVTGATVGDNCNVGFSTFGTTGGINLGCQVSATNTALVTMDNESGVTQDNATGTLKAVVTH